MITDPNVVGYRGECTSPSAHPVDWLVIRRDHARTVLGTVTAKLWIDARDISLARYGGENINVEPAKENL